MMVNCGMDFVNILLKPKAMIKHIHTLTLLLSTFIASAQFDFTMSGLYSAPIKKFCDDQYSDGWGAKFGLGYTFMLPTNFGIETGANWIVSNNGYRKTELDLGDYTLRNNWYNWQLKLNAVWEFENIRPYIGVNAGRARYFTTEYLDFSSTQEDGIEYWDETLYKERVFQYGAQMGAYIKLSEVWSFDLGVSVLKSPQSVKYINFDSFFFDGELIDYDEPSSNPFLVTISAGFRINLSNIEFDSVGGLYSYDDSAYDYSSTSTSRSTCTQSGSQRSGSSSSGSSSGSSSKKGSSEPTLLKKGKTPVNFK